MADNSRQFTEPERPAVLIFNVPPATDEVLDPILWGLEEEGIPSELHEATGAKLHELAKRAADKSILGVGIGVHGSENAVALHHRDLPLDRPLFTVSDRDLEHESLRVLGINAARLVKGQPLVFLGDVKGCGKQNHNNPSAPVDMDAAVRIVTRIVLEMLHMENP